MLTSVKNFVLAVTLFLFPLFFLPTTSEFFATNKMYLLVFAALALLLLATIEFFVQKKIQFKQSSFDTGVLLLFVAALVSLFISSPNKVEAALNLNFGLVLLFAFGLLFFFLKQTDKTFDFMRPLQYSVLVVSVLTIFFFFQPLKNVNFPPDWQLLKNEGFTTMSSQLDLAIFLGFFVVFSASRLIFSKQAEKETSTKKTNKTDNFTLTVLVLTAIAFLMSVFTIVRSIKPETPLLLPPYRLSWFAAVEALKNPLTALFGVGMDNFTSLFTRVKDLIYNQSRIWQINSFAISRSTLLHTVSTTGLFGAAALVLLFVVLFKTVMSAANLKEKITYMLLSLYVLLAFILFPPSQTVFLLFFLTLSQTAKKEAERKDQTSINLSYLPPAYFGVSLLFLVFIVAASYFLGRAYAAEYFFKRSLDGLLARNASALYNSQRQSVILNPFSERGRVSFSQTNLLIARNTIEVARRTQQKQETQQVQLSDQQRQTVAQALQAGIAEAKTAVVLNSQKASHWENLARIYRSIINAAQQADVWTVASYQRAVVLDPRNPIYRLNLGGVYYQLGNYNDAIRRFEEAVALKPDWANAHYNLAWASYQNQDFQRAVSQMQTVLNLLDRQANAQDYQKAKDELETFKAQLPAEGQEATTAGQELQLPQEPQPQISPKLELPETASPEAR